MTGAELRKLRETTGLTQEKFGVLIVGVSGGTVCRWEQGLHPITDIGAAGIISLVAKHLKGAGRSKKVS